MKLVIGLSLIFFLVKPQESDIPIYYQVTDFPDDFEFILKPENIFYEIDSSFLSQNDSVKTNDLTK